jgi:glycosyltransferase involved in cell wall biosynthesis
LKISYAITVCNEEVEIERLVTFLLKHKELQDEIVITYDTKNGSKEVKDFLFNHDGNFRLAPFNFLGNFSDLKNHTKECCKGDYIFHLDADEYPHEILMEQLHTVIEMNDVDLIWIPRVNTVEGLTDEWANKWGWRVTENGWVNYPDYQSRVFRNIDEIHWQNKVHERIVGTKTYAHLPPQEELSLYHPKTIDKQIQQNKFYEGIV